jgi:hypothetical protein
MAWMRHCDIDDIDLVVVHEIGVARVSVGEVVLDLKSVGSLLAARADRDNAAVTRSLEVLGELGRDVSGTEDSETDLVSEHRSSLSAEL